MASSLKPIPRPLSQRWRDVRLRIVPLLAYVGGIVGIVYLWNTQWMPSTFTGEVQARTSIISSPQPGVLADVSVRQFDPVKRGQLLGKVTVKTPEAVTVALAAIRADLQVTRARLALDQHRNEQDSQALSLDYQRLLTARMDQKAALDLAMFDVRYLESDLVRTQSLRSDEYIQRMAAQLKERQELLERLDKAIAAMKPNGPPGNDSAALDSIESAVKAQEEQLRMESEVLLVAAIDGVVTKVARNKGENIAAGEELIAVSADHGENIVGFVRQPLGFDPQIGTRVVVRTRRGLKREAAEAQIVQVGGRLEFFAQALRVRGFDSSQERGLPVLINIPQNLKLYPGELVDLAVKN